MIMAGSFRAWLWTPFPDYGLSIKDLKGLNKIYEDIDAILYTVD
jgi:hypothetical protein